jgi:hypothetical protein
MRGTSWGVLLAVVTAAAGSAAADPNPERADAEFERGRTFLASNRLDDACGAFADSLRDDFQYGTLFNLGVCEEKRGHAAAALRAFRRIEAEDKNADRRAQAKSEITQLAARVAKLVVTVPAGTGGVIVTLDGKDVTPTAEGVVLESGQQKATLEIDAPTPAAPAAPRMTVMAEPQRRHSWVRAAEISGAVGVAALVVGGVYGVSAIRLYNQSFNKGYCTSTSSGTQCTQDGLAIVDDAHSHATLATGLFAAGAALSAAGIAAYVWAPRDHGVELVPVADAHAAGVSLVGSF